MGHYNNHLPRHTAGDELQLIAITASEPWLSQAGERQVSELIRDSVSPSTRRAYSADLARFLAWGGRIPSSARMLAAYLAHMATDHKVASICRALASLSKAHRSSGHQDVTKDELVLAAMAGVRRRLGTAQRAALPILREDLFAMLDKLGTRPKDVRDRALLLLGFATAMRRSELAALDTGDIAAHDKGLIVTLRRSKTDQEGRGREIPVTFGRTRHCPVTALRDWCATAKIETGPIFLAVNKHGTISRAGISGETISDVVKLRLENAGYNPKGYSGHSLRAGFVTSAALVNVPSHKIRQTTGHRSEASLARYIRQIDMFSDPAISRVL